MSIRIVAQVTLAGVPVNGLVDDPEITIRRTDTSAIVAGPADMTDNVGGGLYSFLFTPSVAGLAYGFSIDADPNVTGQVNANERFFGGAFDDELDELYRIRGLDAPNKTVTENVADSDYTEEETGDGADITLDHVKVAGVTTVTRS